MKYIRTQDLGIVIFGKHISHDKMAQKLIGQYSRDQLVSAGFVSGMQDDLSFYGESVSLKLKSLGADDERIYRIQFSI